MNPRILLFVLFLLCGTLLSSQAHVFTEVRIYTETPKLGGLFGKKTDPFPVFRRGVGLSAGYGFPFAAGVLEARAGVTWFHRHKLTLPTGEYDYSSTMLPVTLSYYTPAFIKAKRFRMGARIDGGAYFVSTLVKSASVYTPAKTKQTLGGWGLGIYGGPYTSRRFPNASILVFDFNRIGKYNFYQFGFSLPIALR